MKAPSKTSPEDVVKTVAEHVKARRAGARVPLKVEKGAWRQENGWIVLVVSPTKKGVRAFEYVDALGDMEKELRAEGIDNVILVPALGD